MFKKKFIGFFFIFFSFTILAMEKEIKDNKMIISIHGLGAPGLHHPFVDFFKKTKKLSKNKEEIEQVFSSLNFILTDDSKTNLEEEKHLLEEELKNKHKEGNY